MNRPIRIGTRDSKLAMWQAETVRDLLHGAGLETEIIKTKSEGDLDLVTPLYAMGVQGVFTKTLDAHLLSNRIDIAVHSFKDVPTQMARGIVQAAVLPRGNVHDMFVAHPDKKDVHAHGFVGTGSVRRKAQWLNRYPETRFENLRGNLQTRFRKLQESDWDGAIFAAAGLERLNINIEESVFLDWMLPAPAQGAVVVVCRENEADVLAACAFMNDAQTELCARIERDFLKVLMGGCSTPIGALAQPVENAQILFKGNVVSPDGKQKMEIEKLCPRGSAHDLGKACAQELLNAGAADIIAAIKNFEK